MPDGAQATDGGQLGLVEVAELGQHRFSMPRAPGGAFSGSIADPS